MRVIRSTFSSLLSSRSFRKLMMNCIYYDNADEATSGFGHLRVPLFQRKYCWKTKQWDQLWRDVTGFEEEHSLGKMIFIDQKLYELQRDKSFYLSKITEDYLPSKSEAAGSKEADIVLGREMNVIDGQQRILTILLLLLSFRDGLFSLRAAAIQNLGREAPIIQKIDKQIQYIKKFVVVDSEAYDTWIEERRKKGIFNEGEEISAFQFVPSFFDRESFYRAASEFKLESQERNASETSAVLDAKTFFDRKILSLEEFKASISNSGKRLTEEVLKKANIRVSFLVSRILDRFAITHLELDSGMDAQEIFQNTMFLAQFAKVLVHNANPGMDITPSDLIRNFLLSFLPSPEEQMAVYFGKWLKLERLFKANPYTMDKMLVNYLGVNWDKDKRKLFKNKQKATAEQWARGFASVTKEVENMLVVALLSLYIDYKHFFFTQRAGEEEALSEIAKNEIEDIYSYALNH